MILKNTYLAVINRKNNFPKYLLVQDSGYTEVPKLGDRSILAKKDVL